VTDTTLLSINGTHLKQMVKSAYVNLRNHQEEINALNVFPVPDGDTGINMTLTAKSAWEEIADSNEEVIGRLAKDVARGALMGARGNSGVILSQILRGFSQALDDKIVCDADDLSEALIAGSDMAYRGVKRPVEGTILTVAKAAADGASRAVARGERGIDKILERAVEAARIAEANTPRQLSVLAQAGVTDAGGEGLCVFLEGMLFALRGEAIEEAGEVAEAVAPAAERPRVAKGKRPIPPIKFGFDVQFLIEGRKLDVEKIRQDISAMGDCPLVEGDENLVKVHVHVFDPGVPLAYAVRTGFVTDVVVENMDDMAAQGIIPPDVAESMEGTEAPRVEELASADETSDGEGVEKLPVIAVAPGDGLAEVFKSLGAFKVVRGGQTMNPSIQEIVEAVEEVPGDEVIILPNNGNVIMAAEQAKAVSKKEIYVVPSKTVPQGISAILSAMPDQDVSSNVERMVAALKDVKTGEVTKAVRDAQFNGMEVRKGEPIGLLDGKLAVKGDTIENVVIKLLEQMDAESGEIVTLYCGENTTKEQAEKVASLIEERFPDLEVELVRGNQPHYDFIFSLE
jgi:DAK2 domain fusion protein YloV